MDDTQRIKDLETDVGALRLMLSILLTESPAELTALRESIPLLDDVTLFTGMDDEKRAAVKATIVRMVEGCERAP